jgi:hypothetical protein
MQGEGRRPGEYGPSILLRCNILSKAGLLKLSNDQENEKFGEKSWNLRAL